MTGTIAVLATGTANLASVLAALRRLGTAPRMVAAASDVAAASHLVLPGVGTFAAAMRGLAATGAHAALRRRIEQGRPTLCICLGLQLLAAASDESPGVAGLGIVPATVRRFTPPVPVPQLGWNTVAADAPGILPQQPTHYYFANSYRLADAPAGWLAAWADYGGRFVAGLQRGAVVACQFHPELSGAAGAALLGRWLEVAP